MQAALSFMRIKALDKPRTRLAAYDAGLCKKRFSKQVGGC
jgi:hypothetical protein